MVAIDGILPYIFLSIRHVVACSPVRVHFYFRVCAHVIIANVWHASVCQLPTCARRALTGTRGTIADRVYN